MTGKCWIRRFLFGIVCFAAPSITFAETSRPVGDAADHATEPQHFSLSNSRLTWPTWEQFVRVATLRDRGTRVVLLGTMLFGASAGLVGTFMLLRKRALVGDVVSHASLPGIAIAFLVMEAITPGSGRSLGGLLFGAMVSGLAGVLCATLISRNSRIREDAALAIVLSIFFGFGVALFTVIQNIPSGNQAGLHGFIFGKAALMVADDVMLIAAGAGVVLVISALLFKEFSLLCFDEEFAHTQGWPVIGLDLILMTLVVGVTVIGLESVGLLLVVAMLVIPAAAARFWTDNLGTMTFTSALLGGTSAFLGVVASALFPRLAAGAVIVLVGSTLFLVSLLFGARRGVIRRLWMHASLKRKTGRLDLMREFYECLETMAAAAGESDAASMLDRGVTFDQLLAARTWKPSRLRSLLASAARSNLLRIDDQGRYRLTESGVREALRVVRNHRLWETYLITYADIALSHVDRDADLIEHVLEPEVLRELNSVLAERFPDKAVPPSPHPIERQAATAG